MANLNDHSRRSITPNTFRPTLAHRSQCRYSCHLVRRQFAAFCTCVLFDALGAAESWEEGGAERERVDDGHVEAEEQIRDSEERWVNWWMMAFKETVWELGFLVD